VTAKQRVVLAALRDAQHERGGEAVGGRIADVCPAPWHGRPDLVTAALVQLERDGLALVAAARGRGRSLPPAADARTASRPARERRVIGGGPYPR
jgi:hypothetical protein